MFHVVNSSGDSLRRVFATADDARATVLELVREGSIEVEQVQELALLEVDTRGSPIGAPRRLLDTAEFNALLETGDDDEAVSADTVMALSLGMRLRFAHDASAWCLSLEVWLDDEWQPLITTSVPGSLAADQDDFRIAALTALAETLWRDHQMDDAALALLKSALRRATAQAGPELAVPLLRLALKIDREAQGSEAHRVRDRARHLAIALAESGQEEESARVLAAAGLG